MGRNVNKFPLFSVPARGLSGFAMICASIRTRRISGRRPSIRPKRSPGQIGRNVTSLNEMPVEG